MSRFGNFLSDIFSQAKSHEPSWIQDLPSMPGSPQSLQDAFIKNKWNDPFGGDQNSMDIFAGGVGHPAGSEHPWARGVGRTVGSLFGANALYGLGSSGGLGEAGFGGEAGGTYGGLGGAGGEAGFAGEAGGLGEGMSPTQSASMPFEWDTGPGEGPAMDPELMGQGDYAPPDSPGSSPSDARNPYARNPSMMEQIFKEYPKSTMGVLGGLALLNARSNSRQNKAREKSTQEAQANQQARIALHNANPNTGGMNPSPTQTPYTGTPNFNPFVQQTAADRLAFGPASWQVGHARGGPAGQGPLGMLAQGPGGGQDDTIPARLSDGEYVFSAQDVSDLGDGSTHAGAKKLDQMRQIIRHKAGRKNVKKIAPKQPDAGSYVNKVMA